MRACLPLLLALAGALPAAEPPRVAATIYPLQQLARLVVDDPQRVDLLLHPATGCPHDHVLTPQERAAISSAPVVLANGLDLDWMVTDLLTPTQRLITAGDAVPAQDLVASTCAHGHDHGANPHLFTSPRRAAAIVRHLAERLAALDPAGAVGYRARAAEAAERLERLAADLRAAVAPLARRNLVLQHDSLAYFAADAGLTVVAIIQEEPGVDPGAANLAALAATTRATGAVVVAEPQYPSAIAATLAQEAKAPLVELDSLASGPATVTRDRYEQVLRRNMDLLVSALRTP